jgi:hypothetical protein
MKELFFNYVAEATGASSWILYAVVAVVILVLIMIKVGFATAIKYKKYSLGVIIIVALVIMYQYYINSVVTETTAELKKTKALVSVYEDVIKLNNATITKWEKKTKIHQEKLDELGIELINSQIELKYSIKKQLAKPKLQNCNSAMDYMLDEALQK